MTDRTETTGITWIEFAAEASGIAVVASSWARDAVMPGGGDLVPAERLDSFIGDMKKRIKWFEECLP